MIAKDVADMDDETFAAYGEKMKVLLKDKNKKMLEEKKRKRTRKLPKPKLLKRLLLLSPRKKLLKK